MLDVDHRAPILFLRSFEDDERVKFGSEQQHLLDFSIETRLANHRMRFGPFIAIGSPLDKVPQIGAARARLSDDAWQGVVLGWMNSAALIVMRAGKTKWVMWELRQLAERGFLQKLLVLLPPKRFWRSARRKDSSARLDNLRAALAETEWAAVLGRFSELLLPLGEKGRGSQAIMRNLLIDIWAIFVPAVDDAWRCERLGAVIAVAPAAAKSLVDEHRNFLRNFARQGADAVAHRKSEPGSSSSAPYLPVRNKETVMLRCERARMSGACPMRTKAAISVNRDRVSEPRSMHGPRSGRLLRGSALRAERLRMT